VSCAALSAPFMADCTGFVSLAAKSRAACGAFSICRLIVSRLPMMMVSRLLKSCAMPPDNCPTASIF
jgi:hypothetical protein